MFHTILGVRDGTLGFLREAGAIGGGGKTMLVTVRQKQLAESLRKLSFFFLFFLEHDGGGVGFLGRTSNKPRSKVIKIRDDPDKPLPRASRPGRGFEHNRRVVLPVPLHYSPQRGEKSLFFAAHPC